MAGEKIEQPNVLDLGKKLKKKEQQEQLEGTAERLGQEEKVRRFVNESLRKAEDLLGQEKARKAMGEMNRQRRKKAMRNGNDSNNSVEEEEKEE